MWMKTVMAVGLAVLVLTPAQAVGRPQGQDSPPRWRNQGQNDENGGRRAEMMSQRLGIDTATAQRLQELMRHQMEERKALGDKLKAEMQRLSDQVQAHAAATALNAEINSIRELTTQMGALQAKGIDELVALLGPEKAAQVLVLRHQRMQNVRENVRGRMGQGNQNRGQRRQRGGNTEDGETQGRNE